MSPIEYDDSGIYEEEIDEDVEDIKPEIEEIILRQKVVTERELKVRLEKKIFPWITGRALNAMEREGIIRRVGYRGRKSRTESVPESFFMSYSDEYEDVVGIIERKRKITKYINAILTAHSPAGYHAEDLFEGAFKSLGFKIHGRERSKFNGKVVKGKKGKQLPDLDFIIEKDKIVYGVDVKNWIRYEYNTRVNVRFKVSLAMQLGIVPFIIARYVDKETIYVDIIKKGGICYSYHTLLVPRSFRSLALDAEAFLGYPILALDVLPNYKVQWILKLHTDYLKRSTA
ncbi:hypothetical protein KAU88_03605 [Candidatus Bathyarchaeota archaeon]|nr:hypothetical protein [Candidatus Bathyarchaeota archaeon]